MITVTKTVYKGAEKDNTDFVVEFVKTFKFLEVDAVLKLVETIGFEQDEMFTYPEWGRYVLTRYREETGLEEITIEEE